jgi:hypothetical protein
MEGNRTLGNEALKEAWHAWSEQERNQKAGTYQNSKAYCVTTTSTRKHTYPPTHTHIREHAHTHVHMRAQAHAPTPPHIHAHILTCQGMHWLGSASVALAATMVVFVATAIDPSARGS